MKKSLLKIAIILISVMLLSIGYVYASVTSGFTFGISPYRTDSEGNKYVHTFETSSGLQYIWNFQEYENSIANTDQVFYCLAQTYGDFDGTAVSSAIAGQVPNAIGGTSPSSYTGAYRLKDTGVKDTLNSIYSGTDVTAFSGDTYSGLLWIFDNMYLTGQDDRIAFLDKIPCTEDTVLQGMEGYTVAEAMQITESTEDDPIDLEIEVAQQLAIWTITNNDIISSYPTIYLSLNDGTLKKYSNTYLGSDESIGIAYGTLREYYIKMIYNYLVAGAEDAISSGYTGDSNTIVSVYANAAAQPVATAIREKTLTGEYDVVIKKVDENGNAIEGATFTVDGTDYTTASDGTVTIAENIAISEDNVGVSDTYSIVEKSAPDGYIKYDGTIGVTVSKTESTDGLSYVIDQATLDSTSEASGYVTIDSTTKTITITVENKTIIGDYTVVVKKENEEGEALQGAVFTVNGKNYTTNSGGMATVGINVEINKDNVGITDTYTITELSAPEGYVKYDESITLNITKKLSGETYTVDTAILDAISEASDQVSIRKAGSVIIVTIVDKEMTGAYTVKLNKQDEEGNVLEGAVFTVNETEFTTNAEGMATVASGVEITKDNVDVTDIFTITEITAPDGYVKYDKEITLNITKKEEGESYVIDTVTLDAISEASNDVDVTIEGSIITVTVIDKKIEGNYTIKIKKENAQGEALQGAEFTVNGPNYTTNAEGMATVASNIEINKDNVGETDIYTITEITAPEGYILYRGTIILSVKKKIDGANYIIDSATLDATSEASEDVKVSVENNEITVTIIDGQIEGDYTVKLNKKDEYGQVLNGAVFTVNGTNYTTDSEGFITIVSELEITKDNVNTTDVYTIKEFTAPDGYSKYNDEITLSVTKKENGNSYVIDTATLDATSEASSDVSVTVEENIITVTVIDKKIEGNYTVKLNKQNEEGVVLAGAEFTVNGRNITTDASGFATIAENVEITKDNVNVVDTYTLEEITAPEGYVLYDGVITLEVTKKADGEDYVIDTATLDETSIASNQVKVEIEGNTITVIIIEQKIEGHYIVQIEKQGEYAETLPGAVFTVNGTEFTTDETGHVTIASNVEINKDNVGNTDTYTITELTAPNGYIKYDGEITLSVTKKIDGANYVIDTVTLDATSSASTEVDVIVNENVITLRVINQKIEGNYTVKLNKQNEEGDVLEGAVFTVNGTNITTDEAGFATIAENVEITKDNVNVVDTYTLEEIIAPEGYVLYDGIITLEVTKKANGEDYVIDTATLDETSTASGMVKVEIEGSTITVTVIEEKIEGDYTLKINKKDEEGNTLQGAVFTVNSANYTTDSTGTISIAENIEITKDNVNSTDVYTITELTPPEGYVKYDEEIILSVTKKIDGAKYIINTATLDATSEVSDKVEVNVTDNVITVTVVDKKIKGNYTVKLNKQNEDGVVLEGAVFTVDGKNITTDETGFATIAENVEITKDNVNVVDTYRLEEITAPDGYALYNGVITLEVTKKIDGESYVIDTAILDETSIASNQVKVEIEGNTITVIIIEEKIKGDYTVKINKKDEEGVVLEGAVFTVNGKNYTTDLTGNATIASNIEITKDNVGLTDIYTITESTAPNGYVKHDGEIILSVTKKADGADYLIDTATLDATSEASNDVEISVTDNVITVTVVDKKIEGNYTVKLNKQNEDGVVLEGAVFTVNGTNITTDETGFATIAENVEITKDTVNTVDTYELEEITAPDGYALYDGVITLSVTKKADGINYVIDTATLDETSIASGMVRVEIEGNTITVIIIEEEIKGSYSVRINKQGKNQESLEGAIFTVNGSNYTTEADGYVTIVNDLQITKDNVGVTDTYTITEITAPNGYIKYDGEITLSVTKKSDGAKYIIDTATLDAISEASSDVEVSVTENVITVTVIDKKIEGNYTVKLNKQGPDGEVLQGAVFTVNGANHTTDETGFATVASNIEITKDNVGVTDKYTITELTAPEGYAKYDGEITLSVTKKADGEDYVVDTATLDVVSAISSDVKVKVEGNVITVTVVDKKIEGNYTVKLNKQNKDGVVLQGAVFTVDGTNITTDETGFATIASNVEITKDTVNTVDIYRLEEITAPDGYALYDGVITLNVTKKVDGDSYVIDTATLDETSIASGMVRVEIEGNTITVIVIEEEIKGDYTVKINKQNEDGVALEGAVFAVNGTNYTTDESGVVTVAENIEITKDTVNTVDTYTITELTAPDGYIKYNGEITLNVTKKSDGETYVVNTATLDATSEASNDISVTIEGKVITITIKNKAIEGNYTVRLNKQGEDGVVLEGAIFTVNGTRFATAADGYVTIASNIEITKDNVGVTDTYKITEMVAPNGYVKYEGEITLNVTKKSDGETYVVDTATLDNTSEASNDISLSVEGNVITVTVIDKKIEGNYTVRLNKQGEDGQVLSGAIFTVNGAEFTTDEDGYVTIASNIEITKDNVGATDTYRIIEMTAPEGYAKYDEEITLNVTKKAEGINYVINTATLDSVSEASNEVLVNVEGNIITITVIDKKIAGNYTVRLNKQNEEGVVLQGAVFTVNETEITTDETGYATIASNVEITKDTVNTVDTYILEEIKAPEGYVLYDGVITLNVSKKVDGENYVINTATLDETSIASGMVKVEIEGNTITVIVIEEKIEGAYSVRINKQGEEGEVLPGAVFTVNGTEYTTDEDGYVTIASNIEINQDNLSDTDTYTIKEILAPTGYVLYDGTITLNVKKKVDGETYVLDTVTLDEVSKASSDVDVIVEDNIITVTVIDKKIEGAYTVKINKQGPDGEKLEGAIFTVDGTNYITDVDGNVIIANNVEINNENVGKTDIYVIEETLAPEGYVLYDEPITLNVTKKTEGTNYAVDTATLSTASNEVSVAIEGNIITVTVIDKKIEGNYTVKLNKQNLDGEVLQGAVFEIDGQNYITDEEGNIVIAENVEINTENLTQTDTYTIKEITAPTGYLLNNETIVLNITKKVDGENYVIDTATLNSALDTVQVDVEGNVIIITVLNEEIEGNYAVKINKQNQKGEVLGNAVFAVNGENYTTGIDGFAVVASKVEINKDNVLVKDTYKIQEIKAPTGYVVYDGEIRIEVTKKLVGETYVLDEVTIDETSQASGKVKIEIEGNTITLIVIEDNIDLALRKFISKVVSEDGTEVYSSEELSNRVPVADETNLQEGTDTTGEYNHTKEPLKVSVGDKVTYIFRVYNEGESDAYITEITDHLSEYLEYVDNGEWLVAEDKVTTDSVIVTGASDNLQDQIGKVLKTGILLPAYDKENDIVSYVDVEIKCKVLEPEFIKLGKAEHEITNIAEITGMLDRDGNEVEEDIDSTPENVELPETEDEWSDYKEEEIGEEDYIPGQEDDDDFEKVVVEAQFDLSLLKWVTQAIVIENGETSIIETGHKAEDNPEKVVKVEIKTKDINKVTVKFAYKIRITNEGQIAGYADEITDYIPEGLKFLPEDNPDWYERREGVVATEQLKDVLLQPGESAEVELILTWINGEDNLGLKVNIAEISDDSNAINIEDIDSTPDNEKDEEDDIDDAPVMLVIKTGLGIDTQYLFLGLIVMTILVSGTVAIKKFVL